VTIRPQHPEGQVTSILALHSKITERIDRLRSAGYPIHEHLEAASRDLDELDRRTVVNGSGQTILELVLARTLDNAPGSPRAQALDGQGGTVRTDEDGHIIMRSDPTGDGAMQPDDGARDRREISHHLNAIVRHLLLYTDDPRTHGDVCRKSAQRILAICGNWTPRRADQAVKAKADADAPPGCESCDRVGSWSPIHHEWRQGQLGQAIPLCRPCYERARETGEIPSKAEVDHMKRHGKLPRRRAA
jgi:hypothetical protein